MPKKEIVGNVPGNVLGMLADLCHKLQHGALSPEHLERFLKGHNPFEKPTDQLAEWQDFYLEIFGFETDFSGLVVPTKRKGFDRLVVVAQGMSPQRIYDKCVELFPCYKWTEDNLDEIVQSDRTAKDGAYAVWFRDRVEADKELRNRSADDLKRKGIPGITLEERLLMELKYFKETGNHLEIKNITLCSGSHFRDGDVPRVEWIVGELRVHWDSSTYAHGRLRSRQAVTL